MKLLFFTICIIVMYRTIVEFISIKQSKFVQLTALLKYIGNLALIVILGFSIRDAIKSLDASNME